MSAFSFNPKGSWISTNSNMHSEVGLREGGIMKFLLSVKF